MNLTNGTKECRVPKYSVGTILHAKAETHMGVITDILKQDPTPYGHTYVVKWFVLEPPNDSDPVENTYYEDIITRYFVVV